MFAGAAEIVVVKGKKVRTFAPDEPDFDRAAFEKAVIGPSGNLRAPTLRVGSTFYVGFLEAAWAALA